MSSHDLSDILVLPKPEEANSSRRGVNHDAICITDAEFIDQLKSKELEKKKQQEEAEQKRIQKELRRVEKERRGSLRHKKRLENARGRVTVNALFVAFTLEMTKKIFDGLAAMAALGGGMCPAWI